MIKSYLLALGCVLFLAPCYSVTKEELQVHVEYLSSDALEGRLAGSRGEKLAAQYAADIFKKAGLEPAGDNGTFFQEFEFTAGVSLGKNNLLSITNKDKSIRPLTLNQEWRPLSFSDNREFETTELVFVGYGITAPDYDSYHGLNVKNKWVVVFRYMPEKLSSEQRQQLSQYSSLRYKALTAKQHGAIGIIFVSGPNAKVTHELIPLSFDTSLSGSGIAALSVNDNVIENLLNASKFNSLQKLQDQLDGGKLISMPVFTEIKMLGQVDIKQNKQRGCNVLALLRISPPAKVIIVGAHADHLGRGEAGDTRSRESEKGMIHSGADDNASGVAEVLAAAVTLSDLQKNGKLHDNKNILFAVWSGEELGLLGSSYFINKFNLKKIDSYINLDMVGRLRQSLVLQGAGSSQDWEVLIEKANAKHALSTITQTDPYLPTDSTTFYLHNIPILNLFTGSHDEYHTPRDKAATLNYAGMQRIADFLINLALAIAAEPDATHYKQAAKTSEHISRGFRIYLGTIPDYASDGISGVRLSGVTNDSPANHAGLKRGDVIVELAGKKIHDIYDYTFILSTLTVGKSARLKVMRGSRLVALTVVAGSRE